MALDPQRWQSVKALFFETLEQPTGEREQFLNRHTTEDPELRQLVQDMLHQHFRDVEGFEDDTIQPQFPSRIGPYKVSHLVASTLTTIVVRADRDDGQFTQAVAIKLIHPSAILRETLLRMESERRILASLNHPSICRLLDAGQLATGQHYLILEWIEGVSLLEHARTLDLRAKLLLFREICLVIEAAHRLLIVHRDLKPAHILVTPEGNLKVLDFGIAKLLLDSQATQDGQIQLTPAYASPEQWRGEPATPGFDVFSLGVLFHELLSGRHPLGSSTVQQQDWSNLQIRLADRRLTAIASKAMHPEPAQRYASVEGFRSDIESYLDNKPVAADRSDFIGDSILWAKRNRAILVPIALCLIFGAYEAVQLWSRREVEQERARQAQAAARSIVFQTFEAMSKTNIAPEARRQILLTAIRQLQLSESFENTPDDLMQIANLYGRIGGSLGETFAENLEDYQTAEECARRAVAILDRSPIASPLDRINARMLLADVLFGAGKFDPSRQLYEAMHAAMARLPNAETDFVRMYQTVAQSMIGDIHLAQGRLEESLNIQQQVLAIRNAVHVRNNGRIGDQQIAYNLGNVHYSLAQTYSAMKKLDEAMRHARESVTNLEKVAYPRELAVSIILLAELEQKAGVPFEAHLRQGQQILKGLLEINPGSLPLKRLLAQASERDGEKH